MILQITAYNVDTEHGKFYVHLFKTICVIIHQCVCVGMCAVAVNFGHALPLRVIFMPFAGNFGQTIG